MLNPRTIGLLAATALALASPAARAQMPVPGPFDMNFNWLHNKRALTFCVEANTPAVIANGARDAAITLNQVGSPWFLNNVGVCPMNWSLRAIPGIQPDIRIRIAPLGPLNNLPANGFPELPHETESSPTPVPPSPSPSPYPSGGAGKPNPNDQPPAGANRAFPAGPPLAYFQPGPFVAAGRQIAYGEVVYNYQLVPDGAGNMVPNPRWDTVVGSRAFDPIEVGMHELGHAVRLDHDDLEFNDDVTVIPSGGTVLPFIPNNVAIQAGNDNILQTPAVLDDILFGTDILVGNDFWAGSGKKMNVMRSGILRGQHGVNPFNGLPAGAEWAYTDREQATFNAAAMHMPPGMGTGLHVFAGEGRAMDWKSLGFYNAAGLLIVGWVPGLVQNDLTNDFLVWGAPQAPTLYGESDVFLMNAPANKTAVQLWATLGAAPANTTASLRVWVPYTAVTPKLGIVADWAANTLTYFDMNVNPPVQLCAVWLAVGHPVDCGYRSAGVVVVQLSNVPPPAPPPPPPPPPVKEEAGAM
jgi:hypothetical protein